MTADQLVSILTPEDNKDQNKPYHRRVIAQHRAGATCHGYMEHLLVSERKCCIGAATL